MKELDGLVEYSDFNKDIIQKYKLSDSTILEVEWKNCSYVKRSLSDNETRIMRNLSEEDYKTRHYEFWKDDPYEYTGTYDKEYRIKKGDFTIGIDWGAG